MIVADPQEAADAYIYVVNSIFDQRPEVKQTLDVVPGVHNPNESIVKVGQKLMLGLGGLHKMTAVLKKVVFCDTSGHYQHLDEADYDLSFIGQTILSGEPFKICDYTCSTQDGEGEVERTDWDSRLLLPPGVSPHIPSAERDAAIQEEIAIQKNGLRVGVEDIAQLHQALQYSTFIPQSKWKGE
jgi:hypothetical protein